MIQKLHDAANFLSKLSIRKVGNMAKVYVSFLVARQFKHPVQWGKPFTITIEPTTACNLRCPECPSGLRSFTRPTGRVSQPRFRQIIDEVQAHASLLIFYFQGEPFIHPHFLDMVRYAHQKKLYTITSSNGHFFSDATAQKTVESGLDRLIIAIDGTTQETYEQYRKTGNLNTVLDGTKRLIKWKKKLGSSKPYIIFQFLVVRPNEHQIEAIQALGKKLGVNEVRLKTAQLYNYKHGNPLMPTREEYGRYARKPDGTYVLKNPLRNECWRLWHTAVITWDGEVLPCCFDKDAQHSFGNVNNLKLDKIWRGNLYKEFRQTILKGRKNIDICANCTEGCKVWK